MNNINGMSKSSVYEQQHKQVKEHKGQHHQGTAKADKPEHKGHAGVPQDKVDIGKDNGAVSGYQTYKPDLEAVNRLKAVAQDHLNNLRQMVDKLLSSQSYAVKGMWNESYSAWGSLQGDDGSMASYGFSMQFSFSFEFNYSNTMSGVGQAIQNEAAELVADDGPLGVNQVSANILDFAKAISGGDTSKIDMLFKAVQKGFDQVAALFGGWDKLPEITHKTYDAVKEGFETWKTGGTAAAEESAEQE